MANPLRDAQRMECIVEPYMGLEKFSVSTRLNDLVRYFFTKFLTNVKHAFKDFSHTELEAYNHRYAQQIKLTLKDPLLSIDDLTIPVPKGMSGSYQETVETLISCLKSVDAGSLETALSSVSNWLSYASTEDIESSPMMEDFYKPVYSKKSFEEDKKRLGGLFNRSGIHYSTGKQALVSLEETTQINEALLALTKQYYAKVIKLVKIIEDIERAHSTAVVKPEHSDVLSLGLLDLAYRTSIFATVMELVQQTEHAFVAALGKLKDASART